MAVIARNVVASLTAICHRTGDAFPNDLRPTVDDQQGTGGLSFEELRVQSWRRWSVRHPYYGIRRRWIRGSYYGCWRTSFIRDLWSGQLSISALIQRRYSRQNVAAWEMKICVQ